MAAKNASSTDFQILIPLTIYMFILSLIAAQMMG